MTNSKPANARRSSDSDERAYTYLYLRIGMIVAVVLLLISTIKVRIDAGCWQPSISSYYYTPVRGVLVGTLFAVSLALIVYFGRGFWEDFFLNMAGIFLPIVAVAPTMDTGSCFVTPPVQPRNPDLSVAPWVIDAINNNILSLLWTAVIVIVSTIVVVLAVMIKKNGFNRDKLRKAIQDRKGNRITWRILGLLLAASLMVLLTWVLMLVWDDFYTRAHGYSALAFFVSLFFAIVAVAWRDREDKGWAVGYAVVAGLMVLVAVGIVVMELANVSVVVGAYSILILEIIEMLLFAFYWCMQTYQKWKDRSEDVLTTGRVSVT